MKVERFEIENKIDEIFSLLEQCPSKMLDQNKIIVPSDAVFDLLEELKDSVPEEIGRYRKIIEQKNQIISKANNDAQIVTDDAKRQRDYLVSQENVFAEAKQQAEYMLEEARQESERMLEEAKKNSNQMLEDAEARATYMVNNAQQEAEQIYDSALIYTDEKLDMVQKIAEDVLYTTQENMKNVEISLKGHLEVIRQNREELSKDDYSQGQPYDNNYQENYNEDDDYDDKEEYDD